MCALKINECVQCTYPSVKNVCVLQSAYSSWSITPLLVIVDLFTLSIRNPL